MNVLRLLNRIDLMLKRFEPDENDPRNRAPFWK
jgi:hypothetical protein